MYYASGKNLGQNYEASGTKIRNVRDAIGW